MYPIQGNLGTIWEQMPFKLLYCLTLRPRKDMGVNRERDPRICMPKLRLRDCYRHSQMRKP
jgi:hypothetical protein